jgi:arylsulfatase
MKQPNILWICTDQMRFDTLGCYGNTFVLTPNIDKLAARGVLFENAFSQATMCTPSRSSFLTGRYPRTTRCRENGQNIPEDEVLVTRLLADAGYVCGLAGKLHISACGVKAAPAGERRINDGYHQFNWSHHPVNDWPTNEYSQWLKMKGKRFKPKPIEQSRFVQAGPPAEDHQTTWCAEKAVSFIEANESFDRPWLYSVNMYDPHPPFNPPSDYLQRYLEKLDDIPLPNYVEGELAGKPINQVHDHDGTVKRKYSYMQMSETDHKVLRAAYWAMIDLIDEQVGRILDSLERTNQLDDTIVIFMSDHGELLGDHGNYLKGCYFYDPSIHVPLILSFPGKFSEGKRVAALTELVDLAPTLLEAAGLPKYAGMQGRSLYRQLTAKADEEEIGRSDVYCEYYVTALQPAAERQQHYSTMVRTASHKLVIHHSCGEMELYDLLKDPLETNNVWGDSEYASVQSNMLVRLCNRMADTVDPLPLRLSGY